MFITPWINVIVTMSPLAMWATSWPITASTSSRVMFCSRPVDTATSEEFLNAPVAKALGSPSKMPTSGMPMPALSANLRTVPTIQASSGDCGLSIMRRPAVHLAIGLLISSEMIAPPKPMISAKPSRAVEVQPVGREEAIDAEQAGDHAEHRDDHHIGQDEQKDTFQVEFSVGERCRSDGALRPASAVPAAFASLPGLLFVLEEGVARAPCGGRRVDR